MTKSKTLILFAGLLMAMAAFVVFRSGKGPVIDTHILSLMRLSENDPDRKTLYNDMSQRASRFLGILVGHTNPETTEILHNQLTKELASSPFVQSIPTAPSAQIRRDLFDFYFPYRYQLLTANDRAQLKSPDPLPYFLNRLQAYLYSPTAFSLTGIIPDDPFLFFTELLQSWIPANAGEDLTDNEGRIYSFIGLQLSKDPFDTHHQVELMHWIRDLKNHVHQWEPQAKILIKGALPFAFAERTRTQREILYISLGSALGVLALVVGIFRSIRPLFLSIIPIGAGFLSGLAVTLIIFNKIHLITIAFGTTLIGIGIDYPLHFLSHQAMDEGRSTPHQTLRKIRKGLFFGFITSGLGYVLMGFAPLPILKQMALFTLTGLAMALLTTTWILPHMAPEKITLRPEFFKVFNRLAQFLREVSLVGHKLWILLPLGFLITVGILKLEFNDDVTRLQRPPLDVLSEDTQANRILKGLGNQRSILIEGSTLDVLLERQDALYDQLQSLVSEGTILTVHSLAPFLPSPSRQMENRNLVQQAVLSEKSNLVQGFQKIGLDPTIPNNFLHEISQPLRILSYEMWAKGPASWLPASLFIERSGSKFISMATVGGIQDMNDLKGVIEKISGVSLFDPAETPSSILKNYRKQNMTIIALCYISVGLLMMLLYDVKMGFWIILPSLIGSLTAFGIFGWAKMPVNLIHTLSILLIFSMGVDYTIYMAESVRNHVDLAPTLMAISISALTTLFSFGLLALCQTPVLHAIGMTVLVGMAVSFILSPLPILLSKNRSVGPRAS